MCLHLWARSLSGNAEMHETLHQWQWTACEVYTTSQDSALLSRACVCPGINCWVPLPYVAAKEVRDHLRSVCGAHVPAYLPTRRACESVLPRCACLAAPAVLCSMCLV